MEFLKSRFQVILLPGLLKLLFGSPSSESEPSLSPESELSEYEVYRLNINVMRSYRNLWSCFLFVHAIALYMYGLSFFFFIIPVFEHPRTYLVQLASGAVTSMPRV